MFIDRETFEDASEDELADLSVPDEVLGVLAAHDDRAFETREIASRIDIDAGAVSTALSRLTDRGLVEHKTTYWAVTDDIARLERYSGYERATALLTESVEWSVSRLSSRIVNVSYGVSTRTPSTSFVASCSRSLDTDS
ncbi:MAG: MarR family transcriptional regulator [Haloferacaceae archaeon]